MEGALIHPAPERGRARPRAQRGHGGRPGRIQTEAGFHCNYCQAYVSAVSFLSGVRNRNHCPYCLWSRHLDLYAAGDRLAACKSPMEPIGLTLKATCKKYGPGQGELMLIHLCTDCKRLSINRIAADDDPETIFVIFESSSRLDLQTRSSLDASSIRALSAVQVGKVREQLFGVNNIRFFLDFDVL